MRRKRLLLIHGLLDDNVHARHALLLLQVKCTALWTLQPPCNPW